MDCLTSTDATFWELQLYECTAYFSGFNGICGFAVTTHFDQLQHPHFNKFAIYHSHVFD